ncbi:MAG: TraR/DksA family transcriptional regulator [Burkholderiaceae bacterium]|nr:TraR/DksA family transcriptional regulator [Burkholderiaceae bacterium]
MEIKTQTHLAKLRDLLNYRLAELRADLHAADLAASEASAGAPGFEEVRDTKDAAAQVSDLEVAQAQRQRDADELAQVEQALHRLDAGRYGDCVSCGEAIPLARLWAQPAATRCARCQAESEKAPRAA